LIHKPWVEAKVIEDEVKNLTEICQQAHPHIVNAVRIGELRNTRYLFIDMELCDLNLVEYIYCTRPRELVPTFFIKDQPPPMKARQIWRVMLQIVKGVEYLHQNQVVHRDLKPANGYTCLGKMG
jgi:serine/threonine protein kinase